MMVLIFFLLLIVFLFFKYKNVKSKEKMVLVEEKIELKDLKPNDWYYEAYSYLEKNNAFLNVPFNGELKADEKINKGMLLKMISNLFKINPTENVMELAKKNNLLHSYEDEMITTEEMLFMLFRIANILNKDITIPYLERYLFGYQDHSEVSDYAYEGVSFCVKEKIYVVDGDRLNIKETLTRAKAFDILYKFLLYIEENKSSSTIHLNAPIQNTTEHMRLQNEIDAFAKNHRAIGVSVAYIENGEVVDTFSYGDAMIGISKMSADTKLRIASLSKAFVGIAAMISIENDSMSLDDDIGKFWGIHVNTKNAEDVITVRSLLTHTSSIMDVSENNSNVYYNSMRNNLMYGNAIRNIKSGNIANWNYNNYGFAVLGNTVELANNLELGELLKKYLFDPLDIDASFYGGDLKNTDLIGNTYYNSGSIGRSASETKRYFPDGKPGSNGGSFAGGVVISAYDLGKIVALLSNNGEYRGVRYLPKSVVSNLEDHEGNYKGPFWQAQPLRYITNVYGQDELYYLGGDAYGVHNLIAYNPNTKKGVVILTSGSSFIYDEELSNTLCASIARLLLNK